MNIQVQAQQMLIYSIKNRTNSNWQIGTNLMKFGERKILKDESFGRGWSNKLGSFSVQKVFDVSMKWPNLKARVCMHSCLLSPFKSYEENNVL
jgi:hypothetical protein